MAIFAVLTVFWLFLTVFDDWYTVGTLLVDCDDWYTNGHFCCFTVFWLFLTICTLLVQCCYSLGRHVTIGTPMVIFAVFTVFWLFLTIGTLLVQCCYSLGRPVTIGTVMVKTVKRQWKQQKWQLVYQSSHVYQDCSNTVPTVYQSSKTVKRQSIQQ